MVFSTEFNRKCTDTSRTLVTIAIKDSDLAPSFPVPDLALVLEVRDHLGLPRQCPNEAPPVWCRVLLRGLHVYLRLVNEGRRLVYSSYQQLHESVHHIVIVIIIAYLESIVEENVGCWENISGKAFIPTLIFSGTVLLLSS